MAIYITGDTHIPIDISKLSAKRWKEQKNLTCNDYLIICGDFGGVWNYKGETSEEKFWLKWLDNKPFKVLFIDGNHECFPRLNEYPSENWNGGMIHKIRNNVFHLMRGQIFNIDGTKIFTMGGASSHDKEYRKEGINWWKDELPNDYEYNKAYQNLKNCNFEVDIIVTHCASNYVMEKISNHYKRDKLTCFLEWIRLNVLYDKWYFGHYHIDEVITNKDIALYHNILKY